MALAHVPPFLLTGIALVIGSLPAWPLARQWRVPAATLALGVCGLFGYHFLLLIALRHAPAVEANLVNYFWPLLIVVLAPVLLSGLRWRVVHVIAALVGFAGAALAILGGREVAGGISWGYAAALGSPFGCVIASSTTVDVAREREHARHQPEQADARGREMRDALLVSRA